MCHGELSPIGAQERQRGIECILNDDGRSNVKGVEGSDVEGGHESLRFGQDPGAGSTGLISAGIAAITAWRDKPCKGQRKTGDATRQAAPTLKSVDSGALQTPRGLRVGRLRRAATDQTAPWQDR